jgi:hypothetical protein
MKTFGTVIEVLVMISICSAELHAIVMRKDHDKHIDNCAKRFHGG